MENQKVAIPITYSVDNTYQDERWIKLRIDVCHDGLNKNGSEFSIESFDKSKGTLQNIPILAYVKQTEDGEDFDGHNIEYNVDEEGNVKVNYLEQPVGVIPETNEYELVEKDGRTYVRVIGYVWRKYTNVVEEIVEERQELMVSMEVMVTDHEKAGTTFKINDYYYSAITLLGEDVNPGMHNSNAKVETFALSFEEREAKVKEMANELNQNNESNTFKVEFELSLEKIRNQIYSALHEKYSGTDIYSYPIETYDSHVVYATYNWSTEKEQYFDLTYTIVDDKIVLAESGTEMFPRFLTQEQLEQLDLDKKAFADLNTEVVTLREFKLTIENAQTKADKENLVDQFSKVLDKEVIAEFTKDIDTYSLEELKNKLSNKLAEKELAKFTHKPKTPNEVRTALPDTAVPNSDNKKIYI